MTLTPRQMLILLVLIVGFGVAAFLVSRTDGETPAIDEALWCSAATDLDGTGPIFSGEFEDVTIAQLDETRDALYAVETVAPYDIRDDIARLADFTLIAGQARETMEWPTSFAAARENKDAALDTAIDELELELATCGIRLG